MDNRMTIRVKSRDAARHLRRYYQGLLRQGILDAKISIDGQPFYTSVTDLCKRINIIESWGDEEIEILQMMITDDDTDYSNEQLPIFGTPAHVVM